MSILMSIFLGFVQGVAEFLPISSSGHLSILQNLLKLDYADQSHLFFDVLLHLGTLVSICVVYRKDIKLMLHDGVHFFKGGGKNNTGGERVTPSVRTLFFIIIATLPLFIALPFFDKIELLYYNTTFIGIALIVTGVLLYVSDRFIVHGKKNDKTITLLDALLVGIAQVIALVPGLSRSGTTITAGLLQGFSREYAVRFSLLMSIPAVIGSAILSFIKAVKSGIDWSLMPAYLVGFIVAAVVGYFAIRLIKLLMEKNKFGKFSYYCWAAGLLTIILSIIL